MLYHKEGDQYTPFENLDQHYTRILDTSKVPFLSWLLYSFKRLSQKSLSIQKELDFINQIHGKTTKTTQKIDNHRGLSMSKTTSWRYFNQKYKEEEETRKNLYRDERSVIWVDNYSKFYKLSSTKYIFRFFIPYF